MLPFLVYKSIGNEDEIDHPILKQHFRFSPSGFSH